jgi:hypothetical protein
MVQEFGLVSSGNWHRLQCCEPPLSEKKGFKQLIRRVFLLQLVFKIKGE